MSNHGEIEFCNPILFWTSFQKLDIAVFYNEENLGSFVVNPVTINPLYSTIQKDTFSLEEISSTQHIFMTLDFEFDVDIRLDPNKLITVI